MSGKRKLTGAKSAPTLPAQAAATLASKNGHGDSAPTYEINADALSWEDLYVLMQFDKDAAFTKEMVEQVHDLFDRIVVGGAAAVPVMQTRAVMEQIGAAMQAMGNPKNSPPA